MYQEPEWSCASSQATLSEVHVHVHCMWTSTAIYMYTVHVHMYITLLLYTCRYMCITFSGASHFLMSHDTTETLSPHSSVWRFSSLHSTIGTLYLWKYSVMYKYKVYFRGGGPCIAPSPLEICHYVFAPSWAKLSLDVIYMQDCMYTHFWGTRFEKLFWWLPILLIQGILDQCEEH